LLVYNKIDQLTGVEPRIERDGEGRPLRVWISALTGQGLDLLREAIVEVLDRGRIIRHLQLSTAEGRLRARLYQRGQILQESVDEQGNWILKVELPASEWQILDKHEDLTGHIIGIDQNPRLAVMGEAP